MDVLQPHSRHSYSSWAISSFVRRGGVYLMRVRDASILCAATGARKREWHWSQMTCQGFRAPHWGHVASRSSWRASRRIVAAPHDSHRMNGKSVPPQELQGPRFSTFCVTGAPPIAFRRNRGGGKSVGSE